jgi:hypothetical protein
MSNNYTEDLYDDDVRYEKFKLFTKITYKLVPKLIKISPTIFLDLAVAARS